jgi:flagellar hook-length control protein FliK
MICTPSATVLQRSASQAEVALQTEPTRSFSLTLRDAQACDKPSTAATANESNKTKSHDASEADAQSHAGDAQQSEQSAEAGRTQASEAQKKSQTKTHTGGHEEDTDDDRLAKDADTDEAGDAEKSSKASDKSDANSSAAANGNLALAASLTAAPAQLTSTTAGSVTKGIAGESSGSAGSADAKQASKTATAAAVGAGATVTPSAAANDSDDSTGQSQDSGAKKEKSLGVAGQTDNGPASSSAVPITSTTQSDASSPAPITATSSATSAAEAIASQTVPQSHTTQTPSALTAVQPQQPSAGANDWSQQAEENLSRVTRGIQTAVQQNGGSVTLRVSPPDLGMVRVQMHIESGIVRAEIVAQHESVSSMLSRELGQLKNALEGQGLVVDHLSVQTMSATPPTSQSNGSSNWQAGEDGRSRGQFERDSRDQPSQRRPNDGKTTEFERAMLNLVA